MGLNPTAFATEITTGLLINRSRKIFYPIQNGIPRLLVFPTSLTREFVRSHEERLAREMPGFALPSQVPPPGEEDVLRSFSKEWVSYEWSPKAYWNLSADDMHRTMKFLLDLDRKPMKGGLIAEIGIGIGSTADYVSRTEESELVGVDLGYAVDAAMHNFGRNPLLHIVQASAFSPPFREKTFDLVYSHGVIMATYSTKTAFDQLARLPKVRGRLYIWVYSFQDEERSLERRILMMMERIVRPVIWRLPETLQTIALLPLLPLYIIRQNFLEKGRGASYAHYGWREAIHAARDRFTPRYAHRHTEDEVCAWFHEAGYGELECASKRERPDFVPLAFVAAAAVNGVRQ
jgi:hypothetical protein